MNFKEICELIKLASEQNIPYVEVEHEGVRVKIKSGNTHMKVSGQMIPVSPESPSAKELNEELIFDKSLHLITAPMVGTFYRAPKPGADPFVDVGATVNEGDIVCIIEAMKLMNEIESGVQGEVVSIFVENGTPVEYGQKLFAIKAL